MNLTIWIAWGLASGLAAAWLRRDAVSALAGRNRRLKFPVGHLWGRLVLVAGAMALAFSHGGVAAGLVVFVCLRATAQADALWLARRGAR